MDENVRLDLLKQEYSLLQQFCEDYDRKMLTIKNWSITIGAGGVAFGVQYDAPVIWFVAGLAIVLFWWLEVRWKLFQYAFYGRLDEIEAHLLTYEQHAAALPPEATPLQIHRSWLRTYRALRRPGYSLRIGFASFVAVPHLPIVCAVAALLVWHLDTAGLWT